MDLREVNAQPLLRRHPWELVRARYFISVLEKHHLLARDGAILDAGSGDGWFAQCLAKRLSDARTIICWDHEYTPAQLQAFQEESSLRGPTYTRDAPTERCSLILLLDVLEHIQHDMGFLKELIANNLDADGLILISVPAWAYVFGPHDVFLGHYRRYAPKQLQALVKAANLEIIDRGELFHFPLIVRILQAVAARMAPTRTQPPSTELHWQHGRWITWMAYAMLRIDSLMSIGLSRMGIRIPGLSTWVLCRLERHS
ncbi:MAG: methyltransferase domain-containing protein [Myxococcales bacterium]|nr:methyltransferase domain-containing protein [Myxococcales bacterium]